MELIQSSMECRGGSFKYAFNILASETWWTFQDELEIRNLWWHINPGDVILDVGADLGSYTLPALVAGALKCYTWSIYWRDVLASNIALNGWQDKVVINGYGLWSENGWLFSPPDLEQLSFSKEKIGERSFQVHTLDAAVEFLNIEKADWLKIDIEGAEFEMLKGSIKTLQTLRPKILIEFHHFKDKDLFTKCDKLLYDAGYKNIAIAGYEHHMHSTSHGLYVPQ